jgi:hypothetical protein
VADERDVDEHLVAVLNEVLDAVYQAKQAAWSATAPPVRLVLQETVAFLIDQSGRFMVAEEEIDGRSPEVSSPSSHQRGNIVAEAAGDHAAAVALLVDRLRRVALDARRRADAIGSSPHAPMLVELADGLEARAAQLRPGD